ncbi:SCO4225 family membrane protein [Streptomyces galbus]|uniref:SCO4225 family membrane protein n=1 Tax=Streptomyces galbus TaxID=33898 RepID=UPI0038192B4F
MRTTNSARSAGRTVPADRLLAGMYLSLCIALTVWSVVDGFFVTHSDASFAGIFPLIATAPVSFLVLILPEGSMVGYLVSMTVGALINTWLVYRLVGALRSRMTRLVRADSTPHEQAGR